MRPTVLLYDIDGTLVTTGGAGRRALERAFAEAFGDADAVRTFRFDGMTDRAIARRGLQNLGITPTDAAIDEVLGRYVAALAEEVVAAEWYVLHAGIVESLDAAARSPGFAIGLGTGNLVEGARVKLGRVGLFDRFSFGGFGDDSEHRPELIRIGAERGAAQLGVPVEACRVTVIGDTPLDVAAALAIGAECIGVGTGHYSAAELAACGATWAFDDLADPRALDVLLGA